MFLEILMYCHNFQRRLCWVLSSLCDQTGNVPDFMVNISSLPNNGDPRTEDVIDFFRAKGLTIKHTVFTNVEQFARPSWTKNRQIAESTSDWFLCHSSDHVFHPKHLHYVNDSLAERHKDIQRCIGSIRNVSSLADPADKIISEQYANGMYVEQAYEKAFNLPQFEFDYLHGPGGHLAFSRKLIMEKRKGIYGPKRHNRDRHLFKEGMFSRHDILFRREMGGCKIVHWPPLVHLNHKRDKEVGHHIEDQR